LKRVPHLAGADPAKNGFFIFDRPTVRLSAHCVKKVHYMQMRVDKRSKNQEHGPVVESVNDRMLMGYNLQGEKNEKTTSCYGRYRYSVHRVVTGMRGGQGKIP
jgi:hypothetical protein